jgi:SAM-dependent methyltransferase
MAGISAIVLLLIFNIPNDQEEIWRSNDLAVVWNKLNASIMTCPRDNIPTAFNDNVKNNITAFYNSDEVYLRERLSDIAQRIQKDLGETAFHDLEFDQWHRNYKQVRDIMFPWISSQFTKYIQSNMTIYESACGEGFNLLLTLSILHQHAGVTNVTVYGNEYRSTGVTIARQLLQNMTEKVMPNSRVGSICQGDSTHLYFVPSEQFDVAYTGYVDPLQDPYGFMEDIPNQEAWYHLCQNEEAVKDMDPNTVDQDVLIDALLKKKILQLDQRRQEDWFASWVSELIRIVKPGGAVIIEQVAWPKCIQLEDWGGVDKDWWKKAISTYGWDVDEQSLYMQDMFKGTSEDRYHVSMQKRK